MNIFQDVICSKNLCEDEKGDKVEVHSIIHQCIYLSILQPEVQSRTQSSRPRTQKNPKTDPLEAPVRDILTQPTWHETTHPGNSDARDILTREHPEAKRSKLSHSAFFFFSRYAFFSKRFTFRYCDVSIIFSINCKLHRNLYFAETTQK